MGNPFSSAVGDIFGGIGDLEESSAYGKAADIASNNVEIAKQSTQIQETQEQRQIYQALGSERAAAGANGLTTGGSAGDILRASASQGSLAKALISRQGAINENSFQQEADAYKGMQSAANASAISSFISAPLNFIP